MAIIGVLSDAHGNALSFTKTIRLLKREGAERFVFLGDAIGYIPSAAALIEINTLGTQIECVRGNHEHLLLEGVIDEEADKQYQLSTLHKVLNPELKEMIRQWPTELRSQEEGRAALYVHGHPLDPVSGYLYEDSEIDNRSLRDKFIFMGHTHIPFVRRQDGITFVNVGSCGLPRDDGRFGSAALFDPTTGDVQIIRFDIQDDLQRTFQSNPSTHPAVMKLVERRTKGIYGRIVSR